MSENSEGPKWPFKNPSWVTFLKASLIYSQRVEDNLSKNGLRIEGLPKKRINWSGSSLEPLSLWEPEENTTDGWQGFMIYCFLWQSCIFRESSKLNTRTGTENRQKHGKCPLEKSLHKKWNRPFTWEVPRWKRTHKV